MKEVYFEQQVDTLKSILELESRDDAVDVMKEAQDLYDKIELIKKSNSYKNSASLAIACAAQACHITTDYPEDKELCEGLVGGDLIDMTFVVADIAD